MITGIFEVKYDKIDMLKIFGQTEMVLLHRLTVYLI